VKAELDYMVTLAIRRPLVSLDTAAAALSKSNDDVLKLIDAGKILWAWDFGTGQSVNRLVRVWAASVMDYQSHRRAPVQSEASELRLIITHLFPGLSAQPGVVATVRASVLAERLGISSEIPSRLAKAGWLKIAKPARARSGRHGSPEISLNSVADLLKRRRIT